MSNVVFCNSWQEYFDAAGLRTFEDFFNLDKGELVNKNHRRDVRRFSLTRDQQEKVFYMKRFYNPHFKDRVFASRKHRLGASIAELEYVNSTAILKAGVETYRPTAYGSEKLLGYEKKSFLVTEEMKATCLTDYISQNFRNMTRQQKEKLVITLADAIRKLHRAGISLPDLYVWHLYLMQDSTDDHFHWAVIDLHRASSKVTDQNKKIRNLGALDHSMLDKYFDNDLRKLFVKSYVKNSGLFAFDAVWKKMKARSAKISSRRNVKEY